MPTVPSGKSVSHKNIALRYKAPGPGFAVPAHSIPVTVVIPALNEAARIGRAVRSVRWASEVIVVDGGSSDSTAELAHAAGARVLVVPGKTIAAQRNAGISEARNRWVLALDCDEHVTDELREEIAHVVAAPRLEAYRIPFRNFYLGHEMQHGRWGNESHVRLFQNNRRFLERRVHENLEPIAEVGMLRAPIEHQPYRDLAHHLEKMTRYARWAADDMAQRNRPSSFADLSIRPLWRFFREYFLCDGWKDGRAGFLVAALSAFSALLKYAHLQELQWQAEAESGAKLRQLPIPLESASAARAPES